MMKKIFISFVVMLLLAAAGIAQDQPGTVKFPTALDSQDSLVRATNSARSSLSADINSSVTTITVGSTASFPGSGVGMIDTEIFLYTSKDSTHFLGVTRGADGTTAATHTSGASVRGVIAAIQMNAVKNATIAVETKLGTGSSTPTSGAFLKGTGAGTSGWSALSGGDIAAALGFTPASAAAGVSSFNTRVGAVSLSSGDVTAALGYTPLRPSLNLSDVALASTARANLGLGTIATQSAGSVSLTGTFAGTHSGNGSGLTGVLAAGTGGTSSTGALGLIADSDNSGGADQRIDFIYGSGGSSSTKMSLVGGKLGIGMDPSSLSGLLQFKANDGYIVRFKTDEPSISPDFTMDVYGTDFVGQTFEGAPRKTQDMVIGYNRSNLQYPNEPKLEIRWEMFYEGYGAGNVDEWHLAYTRNSTDSRGEVRAFTWLFNRDNDYVEGDIHANVFGFGDPAGLNEKWLVISSGPTSGLITVGGNSHIDWTSAGADILSSSTLGFSLIKNLTSVSGRGREWRLFDSTSGDDQIRLFGANGSYGGVDNRLLFGPGEVGFRNANGTMQYRDSTGAWRNFNENEYRLDQPYGGSDITRQIVNNGDAAGIEAFSLYEGTNERAKIQYNNGGPGLLLSTLGTAAIYFAPTNVVRMSVDTSAASGETFTTVYESTGTAYKVKIGAADSCGTGYRCLRIVN